MKTKTWKYIYGESILKKSEGGLESTPMDFNRLNKSIQKKFIGRVYFHGDYSPYVGHWAPTVYASDLEALRYGVSVAKNNAFFDGTIKDAVEYAKSGWWKK